MIPGDGLFSQEAKNLGVNVNNLAVPKIRISNIISLSKAIYSFLKYCKKNKIDIIHSYSPRNNLLSSCTGNILRIPVIWHERNIPANREIDISKRFSFIPDRIICNSRAVSERFRKRSKVPKNVKVILNGVNLEKFKPGSIDEEIYHTWNIRGRKIVGMISNLSRRKMPELLIEASPFILGKCPKTVFMIVGGEIDKSDEGRMQRLKEKALRIGSGDAFRFTDYCNDTSSIIRAFHVGAAVTEKEACSRAILEIMATGKPVVAFNTGGNPELIEHGETGLLVDFGDIQSFAAAIVMLLRDNTKRERMGIKARRRAETLFDVKINTCKTESLYSEVLCV
jgi:glycosyltransferase involved in cell wall biosynthesis